MQLKAGDLEKVGREVATGTIVQSVSRLLALLCSSV